MFVFCGVVRGDFEDFQICPVCGLCTLLCKNFEYLQTSLCVGFVMWCGDLEDFQISSVWGLCAVVCGYFENFQSSPVCGLCTVVCRDLKIFSSPVCGYFENFQSSLVCGPCAVWGLVKVSKFPCVWDFVPVLESLSFHKKSLSATQR